MSVCPLPKEILSTLLPFLKVAGAYAAQIQQRIAALPDKYDGDNLFANALTDADLSVQTFMEVALLAKFPNARFYGEEYEKSYNTKYFRAIDLGPKGDYLITLDPIDGTRYYMDGHANYLLIMTVLNDDEFEAAIALSPANNCYYYSLRGQGTFVGGLDDELDQCKPLKIDNPGETVLLGTLLSPIAPVVRSHFPTIDLKTEYSSKTPVPPINGLLTGEVAGVILASAQFIDTAALAWMAQEMGYCLTTYEGNPLPPLSACQDYRRSEIIVSATEAMQQKLIEIMKTVEL
ncbi:MAG: myo-inositol-1(or 4)-monophosphatase [Phormidesmis priestleyi Ana]|uniref:Myo-inositol-1(Or 4)-monophosphatase n=1 Tax=Phormidesmis priestleyi Ana TaxID=1666911 RepID=A0A0P7ZS25_9CYAN|nr:MAG: myo-inositol-1(or 4)-monophosphatase [Phormidesmis priestleyi Ana]